MQSVEHRPKRVLKEAVAAQKRFALAQSELHKTRDTVKKWHQAAQNGELYREVGTMLILFFPLLCCPVIGFAALKKTRVPLQFATVLVFFSMALCWISFTTYLDVAVVNADMCAEMDHAEANPGKYLPAEEARMVAVCLAREPLTAAVAVKGKFEPAKFVFPSVLDQQVPAHELTGKELKSLAKKLAKEQAHLHKSVDDKIKPFVMASQTVSEADCSNINVAYRQTKTVVCKDILTANARLASIFMVLGFLLMILAFLIPVANTRMSIIDKNAVFTHDVEPFLP
jgi:hypothetical protein